jgi:hypothetical protein
MLRVNLLEDAEFRKDLIAMAKGVLREVGKSIIEEAIKQEGWLEKKVGDYFGANPVGILVEQQLRITRTWEKPEIMKTIEGRIEDITKRIAGDIISREISGIRVKMEGQVRDIVRAELRNVLGSGLGKN